MLRSLKDLEGYTVAATDGDIGRVVDVLLDDEHWTVRALVVRTSFLEGRRVLISPISFQRADWETQRFHVALTVDKVKGSPSVNVDKPVSRQHERDYYGYYGYPQYWDMPERGEWDILPRSSRSADGARRPPETPTAVRPTCTFAAPACFGVITSKERTSRSGMSKTSS